MKKTPDQWLKTKDYMDYIILDPDGWNRSARDWDKEWNTPLTKKEFNDKFMMSTVMGKHSFIK